MNRSISKPARADQLFERLCLYRALYERRGSRDTEVVMSIEVIVDYAEWLMCHDALLDRLVTSEA